MGLRPPEKTTFGKTGAYTFLILGLERRGGGGGTSADAPTGIPERGRPAGRGPAGVRGPGAGDEPPATRATGDRQRTRKKPPARAPPGGGGGPPRGGPPVGGAGGKKWEGRRAIAPRFLSSLFNQTNHGQTRNNSHGGASPLPGAAERGGSLGWPFLFVVLGVCLGFRFAFVSLESRLCLARSV